MTMSKELREAKVTITYDPPSGQYILTSSINPKLLYHGPTRHRVLSNFQLDTPGYLAWVKEIAK